MGVSNYSVYEIKCFLMFFSAARMTHFRHLWCEQTLQFRNNQSPLPGTCGPSTLRLPCPLRSRYSFPVSYCHSIPWDKCLLHRRPVLSTNLIHPIWILPFFQQLWVVYMQAFSQGLTELHKTSGRESVLNETGPNTTWRALWLKRDLTRDSI